MRIHKIGFIAFLVLAMCDTATAACAAIPPHDPDSISKAWWDAFSRGDVAYLEARSRDSVFVTLNNGRALDREQLLAEAATHAHAAVSATWSDQMVHKIDESAVAVNLRVTEIVGTRAAHYRYVSVLQCASGGWQVVTAQSTRELRETPRVPSSTAGNLQDFAGEYRTPGGKTIQLLVDAGGLLLVDPSGSRTLLEPIAPALFEARGVSVQGLIRFSFVRNADGAVAAFNRITTEVITFPRVPALTGSPVPPMNE
jgi:hypothetical protein